ncbi:MAG: guanylate kinase [Candidatus Omnitrophota bacterium]|nr:guanylate kinase [Candidatus Omnitrophota bacterium]
MHSMREGKLFIVSAPSGCGKTTLCKKLLRHKLNLSHSVSVTTRPPRPGEIEGKDYFFVSLEEFRAMAKRKEFLENEENFGYFYGTPKKFVENLLAKGKNVLLSIDVKGAARISALYPGKSVLIFIMPPTLGVLKKRLESRMTDPAHSISNRLKIAKHEIKYKGRYDYVVVNDRLDTACRKLKNIIKKETLNAGHTDG